MRGRGEEDEVDVLATRWLCGNGAAHGALQALCAAFALAQLEQVGDLLGQGDRLGDAFGGDDGAAIAFPVLAERGKHAVAPFAARHQGHRANHAVGAGAARDFAGFVFGRQAELEKLWRGVLAGVGVIQGESRDRQLRIGGQFFYQRFFQRADYQLHAIGLGLTIEVVQRADA
ncbi:hypothetical protein D3C78_980390 [compost metagenome]